MSKVLRYLGNRVRSRPFLPSRFDWILERFASARVACDPSPHLIIENLLPPELYAAMERDIPRGPEWGLAGAAELVKIRRREAEGAALRRQFEIGRQTLADLAAMRLPYQAALDVQNEERTTKFLRGHSKLWQRAYLPYVQMISASLKQAFAPSAAEYMRHLIGAGLYEAPQDHETYFHEFCMRSEGWAIRPHAHNLQQAIQWMLYFPLPGSTEDQGTALYRLIKPKKISRADLANTIWFEPDEVEYCLMAPYRPNTLIAFLNTPTTVHGTITIPNMVARRYLFIGNFWKTPPIDRDIEVAPDRAGFAAQSSALNAVSA